MIYRALADFVVLLHMTFVLFAALGGVLVFKWRRIAWFHIPAVIDDQSYVKLHDCYGKH